MNNFSRYTIPSSMGSLIDANTIVVRSPGRINLIGEHTDYNNGFVLPAAIDKAVYVAIKKTNGDQCTLYATGFDESITVRLADIRPMPGHWATYILGVVDQLVKRGYVITGFDLSIHGDVPLGAGLSSSAAVECATAFALNELFALGIDKKELVLVSQMAEHVFAGVKCGIMDQFASMYGKQNQVIKLDCRSLEFEYFPMNITGYTIVLLDSQVKHSLASTAYNTRRQQCEEGVSAIQKKYVDVQSLRDVSMHMIEECLQYDAIIYKRCKYVVEENARLLAACTDLQQGNIEGLGNKMFATHAGLSDEYEVSCPELDVLVNTVKGIPAVIGARMMGGGFGGCTINIVKDDAVDSFIETTKEKYHQAIQKELKPYVVQVEEGTCLIH